jgi:hypothetical protein
MCDVVYALRKDRRLEASEGITEMEIVCVKGRDIAGPPPFRVASRYRDSTGVVRSYLDEKHDLVALTEESRERAEVERLTQFIRSQASPPSLHQIEENAGVPRNLTRTLMTKYQGIHWQPVKRKRPGGTGFELIPGQEELRRSASDRVIKMNFARLKSASRRTSELKRSSSSA